METDFLKFNSSFAVWELILHLLKLLLVANPFPVVRLPEQVKPSIWVLVWVWSFHHYGFRGIAILSVKSLCILSVCVYSNQIILIYSCIEALTSLLFVLHCSCTWTNHSSELCQKQLFMAWWRSHFSLYFIILLHTNYKLKLFIYSNHRGSAVLLGTLHGNAKCKEESCSLSGLVFPMHRLPAITDAWRNPQFTYSANLCVLVLFNIHCEEGILEDF